MNKPIKTITKLKTKYVLSKDFNCRIMYILMFFQIMLNSLTRLYSFF